MIELLRDPVWQFVGAVIALLGVPFASRRRRKRLSYEVAVTSVVSVHSGATDLVRVLHDGRDIPDPQLVLLRVINDGSVPIAPTDYSAPLSIPFTATAVPIAPAVIRQSPTNLGVVLSIRESEIQVAPLLMNPGDWFEVRFLTSRGAPRIHPVARIVGAPNPSPIVAPFVSAGSSTVAMGAGAALLLLLYRFVPQLHIAAASTLSLGVAVQIAARLTRYVSTRRYPWRSASDV